jgi:hypothetical protein
MRRWFIPVVTCLTLGVVGAAPAAAEGRGAIGYAYLRSLEEGGGSVPLGAFLSLHGTDSTTLAIDLGYHRDTEGGITLQTFTATAGPRVASSGYSGATPFLHVLGGIRYDRLDGEGNSSFGGIAGVGIDLRTDGLGLRLGADFQIFFDEGENVKTLRLGVGLTF